VGGAIANYSGELVRSGYMAQPALAGARTLPRLSAGCERLWIAGVAEFAGVLRSTALSEARLIHHRARWATHLRRPDGALEPIQGVEIVLGQPAEIGPYNALLERQDTAFATAMGAMDVVQAPGTPLADPQHRWGLSPFHYTPEYYEAIRDQLTSLPGLESAFRSPDAESSPPDAPSAQVA